MTHDPVQQALAELDSGDRSRRIEALRLLRAETDRRIAPRLLMLLEDADSDVRRLSAEGLGKNGGAGAVRALSDALYDDHPAVRAAAADALGIIGERAAVPALIDALYDENINVQFAAAMAIGLIADPRAVVDLIYLLDNADIPLAMMAAQALYKIGTPEARSAIQHLRDEDGIYHFNVPANVYPSQLLPAETHDMQSLESAKIFQQLQSRLEMGVLTAPYDAQVLDITKLIEQGERARQLNPENIPSVQWGKQLRALGDLLRLLEGEQSFQERRIGEAIRIWKLVTDEVPGFKALAEQRVMDAENRLHDDLLVDQAIDHAQRFLDENDPRQAYETLIPHEAKFDASHYQQIEDLLRTIRAKLRDLQDEQQADDDETLRHISPDRLHDLVDEEALAETPGSSSPTKEAETAPEPVQFSAYYPREVAPNAWHPLKAYVFKPGAANAVSADAAKELGARLPSYREVERPAQVSIAEGALITATPELDGFQFNPPSAQVAFYEDWQRFDFKLRAVGAAREQASNGTITFTVEGVIVADIPLSVYVGEARTPDDIPASVTRPIYQSIFCSYSHRDTQIVERVERAYKALGMTFLRDVVTLRSGQDWDAELLKLIERADIFQLFWSKAASESKAVRKEWLHALSLKRQDVAFIRPVYWEQPMPPPAPELAAIHFAFEPELDQA